MKNLSIILLTLTTMTTTLKAQSHTQDEAAINQTLAAFINSWNKNDFSNMKDYLTADCHWVNVVGMHWHNLKEIQFAHQTYANTMFKGVKLTPLSNSIRFLTSDVAIVYSSTHIDTYYAGHGTVKRGDNDNLGTLVLVKQNGKWMITSAENVDVVAMVAADNPVLHMQE